MPSSPDHWTVLYRGPLSSCNYACGYCPFAKTRNTRAELEDDRLRLEKFVSFIQGRQERIRLLFTPWGEAMVHRSYQRALADLSHTPHVMRVAVQTNLSGKLDWLDTCDWSKAALWTTWHPSQTTRAKFVAQCARLAEAGARYSVGVVGMKEHLAEIEAIRQDLPPSVYVWVNAYKRVTDYYTPGEVERLTEIDPVFPVNLRRHPSLGKACRAGHTAFTVDGTGDIRRCHFIKEVIGNLYEPGMEDHLRERICEAATCGCHIGYMHMKSPGMEEVFGDQALERIPVGWPDRRPDSQVISRLATQGIQG